MRRGRPAPTRVDVETTDADAFCARRLRHVADGVEVDDGATLALVLLTISDDGTRVDSWGWRDVETNERVARAVRGALLAVVGTDDIAGGSS